MPYNSRCDTMHFFNMLSLAQRSLSPSQARTHTGGYFCLIIFSRSLASACVECARFQYTIRTTKRVFSIVFADPVSLEVIKCTRIALFLSLFSPIGLHYPGGMEILACQNARARASEMARAQKGVPTDFARNTYPVARIPGHRISLPLHPRAAKSQRDCRRIHVRKVGAPEPTELLTNVDER